MNGTLASGMSMPGPTAEFFFSPPAPGVYAVQIVGRGANVASYAPLSAFVAVAARPQLANVSTRLKVGTGADVLIGGFIVTGPGSKKVIVRAIGPTSGVSGALQDPVVTLQDGNGQVLGSNDDWRDSQEAAIIASGVPPGNEREAAIVETLQPGNYTATVRGKDGATGVALVEMYDLDPAADSQLANISTRGSCKPATTS